MQDTFAHEFLSLIEEPEAVTIDKLVHELIARGRGVSLTAESLDQSLIGHTGSVQESVWIGRSPVTIKLRLFCLPYAGGVSENVFARCVPPLYGTSLSSSFVPMSEILLPASPIQ